MKTIETYAQLIPALNEYGFIPFGGAKATGLTGLGELTEWGNWHTGEAETDPWQWKNRILEERDGVYTRAAGMTFLISKEWHPVFIAACRPEASYEERWAEGKLKEPVWRLSQAFEAERRIARHRASEILAGLTSAQVGHTIELLQGEMLITAAGEQQRLSVDFRPIGWPSVLYEMLDDWAGQAVIERAEAMDRREAAGRIVDRAMELSPGADRLKLDRLFGISKGGRKKT